MPMLGGKPLSIGCPWASADRFRRSLIEEMKRQEELGLNPNEEAFYDALADRPEVLLSMGDATLKKLASELTEKLRNSTTVDCLRASR